MVARRAVYHTLNVITISLYVRPSIKRVLGRGLHPLLKKWSVNITDHFWPFFPKWVTPPQDPFSKFFF